MSVTSLDEGRQTTQLPFMRMITRTEASPSRPDLHVRTSSVQSAVVLLGSQHDRCSLASAGYRTRAHQLRALDELSAETGTVALGRRRATVGRGVLWVLWRVCTRRTPARILLATSPAIP